MFKSLLNKKENGQGMVEYALILVLVAVVVIVALTVMGPQVHAVLTTVNGSFVTGGGEGAGAVPTAIPLATWHVCANEGGFCSFTGSAPVRYGANGTYATLTFANGAECDNSTFGDPVPGIVKKCEYYQ